MISTAYAEPRSIFDFPELLSSKHLRLEGPIGEFVNNIWTLELMDNPLYVDVQCSRTTEGEVIKEFAAKCKGGPTAWILVKSPQNAQPDIECSKTHGICWDQGIIDELMLYSFTKKLFNNFRRVCIKGRRKVKVLVEKLNISRSCIDVLFDAPKLRVLSLLEDKPQCKYHEYFYGKDKKRGVECAMENVNTLVSYLEEVLVCND